MTTWKVLVGKYLVCAWTVAHMLFLVGGATADASAEGAGPAEATLWGVYGAHNRHDCPVNNRETAKEVIALSLKDLAPLMEKYGVTAVVDQYHSGLEHTLLWVVETRRPHDLEEFSVELGLARWNDLKFVPLRTFKEGVVDAVRVLHGLEDWEP